MRVTLQNLTLSTLDFLKVCSKMREKELSAVFARQVSNQSKLVGNWCCGVGEAGDAARNPAGCLQDVFDGRFSGC